MPKLVVFRGEVVEAERTLAVGNLRIGRDAQNDIVLDDPTSGVSRIHAEIRAEGGAYWIVDLQSRNGIWLNKKRVEKAELTLGTPVIMGAYELVLEDQTGSQNVDSQVTRRDPVVSKLPPEPVKPPVPVKVAAASGGKQRLWLLSGAALLVVLVSVAVALKKRPASSVDRGENIPPLSAVDVVPADYLVSLQTPSEVNPIVSQIGNQDDTPRRPPPPPSDAGTAVAGIPKLTAETWAEYRVRATNVRTNYDKGMKALGERAFAAAISSFNDVERDQRGYLDVAARLVEAGAQQQQAQEQAARAERARNAIRSAENSEEAKQWADAWHWYKRARESDSASNVEDKIRPLRERVVKDATALLSTAQTAEKLGRRATAIESYEQILKLLEPGDADDIRSPAAARLKVLKP